MTRFACSMVLFVVVVVIAACSKDDSKFCAINPDDPMCRMEIDAPPSPVRCEDTGCPMADLKVCDTASHKCVQCIAPGETDACEGTTPVCNNATYTCGACRVSEDCPLSDVCLASGACAIETDVAYVDENGTDNTSCTKAMPCDKAEQALLTSRPYVKFYGSVDGQIAIARNVTLFADPGAELKGITSGEAVVAVSGTSVVEISDLKISESDSDDAPGISTSDMAELTLKRVTISNNKGNGITCAGKSLVISDSTISENDFAGISCTAGNITVSSSTLSKNKGGGIVLSKASFDITNNFIVRNGTPGTGSGSTVGGVSLLPDTVASGSRFEFNTVVDNHIKESTTLAGGVLCDMELAAANNIIAHNDVNDNSTTKPNANILGMCAFSTSSVLTDPAELKFVGPEDYHLQSTSTAIGMATTPSAVTVDFDGDARPQDVGNDRGADEYKAAP